MLIALAREPGTRLRRNHYEVDPAVPLRHPAEREHAVGELLRVFTTI